MLLLLHTAATPQLLPLLLLLLLGAIYCPLMPLPLLLLLPCQGPGGYAPCGAR